MINIEFLDTIAQNFEDRELNESSVVDLRKKWPDVHFTYCMDDDVGISKAVKEANGFNIYLVSGKNNHCLEFTSSFENATGLVIAELDKDDEFLHAS